MKILCYDDVTVLTIDGMRLIAKHHGIQAIYTRDADMLDWQIHPGDYWLSAICWLMGADPKRPPQLTFSDPGIPGSLKAVFDVTRDSIHRHIFISTEMALRIAEDKRHVTSE